MKIQLPTLRDVEDAELDAAAAELLAIPTRPLRALRRRAALMRRIWEAEQRLVQMATASAGLVPEAQ